jgi:hypothetical protein
MILSVALVLTEIKVYKFNKLRRSDTVSIALNMRKGFVSDRLHHVSCSNYLLNWH